MNASPSASTPAPSSPPTALRMLLRDPISCIALALLATLFVCAAAAPLIAPYDPLAINMAKVLRAPSFEHLFGTDGQGRDIFSRCLYGLRITILLGFAAIAAGGVAGAAVGLLAAFYPRTDAWLMRLMDVILSFPAILFGLAIAAILGAGTTAVVIALAVSTTPLVARIARGAGLMVLAQDYVSGGRAIGLDDWTLLTRYVLPNCVSTIMVFLTLRLGQAILLGSSLSFLGLGTQPPTPELGTMAAQGIGFFFFAPHVTLVPSVVIFVLVLSMNVLGDSLRDILDPRLRS